MRDKIKDNIAKIVFGGFALITLLGAGYLFFRNVPISRTAVDVSFTATKLDVSGAPIGTFPITIKGDIEKYLFQDDRLDVQIEPFDGYTDFKQHNINGVKGLIVDWVDFYRTRYVATGSEGFEYFAIYFNEDQSRWALIVEDHTFAVNGRYIGSTDPNVSVQDLRDYFGDTLQTE